MLSCGEPSGDLYAGAHGNPFAYARAHGYAGARGHRQHELKMGVTTLERLCRSDKSGRQVFDLAATAARQQRQ